MTQIKPGLVTCTTSGQETEWVYSYNPGAHTKWELNHDNSPSSSPSE